MPEGENLKYMRRNLQWVGGAWYGPGLRGREKANPRITEVTRGLQCKFHFEFG